MMPMGKQPMSMMDEPPEVEGEGEGELSPEAKIEAVRAALRELQDIVGGSMLDSARAKKAAPSVKVEVEPEEE